MNTSDQACARYIILVLIHEPGVKPRLQLSEIGKHCSKFVAKNAMNHATVTPIMNHEIAENAFVGKILGQRFSLPVCPIVNI